MPRTALLAPVVAALSAGCSVLEGTAGPVTYEQLHGQQGWILVDDMRHVAQETDDDCGAAALSSVLARWGVDVPTATLREECSVPGVSGIRAADLRDAARGRGLSAFLFEGGVADLEHELKRGRPVIVGLVKALGPLSRTHFEVVVGLLPSEAVAAIDPARGLVRDELSSFTAEWAATRGVTLVVFRPVKEAQQQSSMVP